MSAHTQTQLEAIGTLVRTNLTHGGFLVAEFYGSDGTPHSDEAKANASLFVVAKDLLEVAEMVLGLANVYMPQELIDAAGEAVAKARGLKQ